MELERTCSIGVEACDDLGWNTLIRAVYSGDSQITMNLLTHVCSTTKHGVTAFTVAVLNGDESLLRLLYDHLTPELQDTESHMALEVACVFGREVAVKWLLSNTCVRVNNISTLTGTTPLHLATIGRHHNIIKLLLSKGADPQIKTSLGEDVSDLRKYFEDYESFVVAEKENISPCQNVLFCFNKDSPTIDPIFSPNDIVLDLNGDIVLKKSPHRPVFKTDKDQPYNNDIKPLLSSSMHSVFLPSPELCSTPKRVALSGLISPRYKPLPSALDNMETPKNGKKRKLLQKSRCSLWLKRFTKKGRTKSLDESDNGYDDLNNSTHFGFDFLQLLFKLGLEDFYPVFKEQELDIWTFLTLTEEDLDAMGISDVDSKKRILKGISALRKTQL